MYYIAKSKPVNSVTKENYYLFTEHDFGYLLKKVDNEYFIISEKVHLTPLSSEWLWDIVKEIDKNTLSVKIIN